MICQSETNAEASLEFIVIQGLEHNLASVESDLFSDCKCRLDRRRPRILAVVKMSGIPLLNSTFSNPGKIQMFEGVWSLKDTGVYQAGRVRLDDAIGCIMGIGVPCVSGAWI